MIFLQEVELAVMTKITKKITDFHNQASLLDFINLQHGSRRLWREWLSYEGFFANYYLTFQVRENEKAEVYK